MINVADFGKSSVNETIREKILGLQQAILEEQPESKFSLEPGEQENIWNFCIYTPEGNLRMPPQIMHQLDSIWREHHVTVLAVVYPLSLYQDNG